MKFQPEVEDLESAWNSRETHEARMEFLQTLPDDALNSLVGGDFWPHHEEKTELLSAAHAHPGLTMLSALMNYAASPASWIARCEREGKDHHEPTEVIDVILNLRDKLNDFAFVDHIEKYQHFSSPLKHLLKQDVEQIYGRFAVSPAVLQYARDAMTEYKTASDKVRYNVAGEALNNQEMVKALMGAIEDPARGEEASRLGRAAKWLRARFVAS